MTTKNSKEYWWKSAKIYELYVDTFAGNFAGLTARLSYFTELGIDCLHILPHYPSPMVDEGYDITDYRSVRASLGTLEDCVRFIQEAHRHNIRVIFDFALNHTSEQHPWFVEARSSLQNPKRDFYLWSATGTEFEGATNAFVDIKSNNWIKNDVTDDYYFATFYPQQPDLNWDNPEVFDAMLSPMEFWANLGVDGFRLDAAAHLIKRENTSSRDLPETHELLKRIRARLEANYPEVFLLAEVAQSIEVSKEYFGNGDECHLVYNFPLMQQFWLALADNSTTQLDAAIFESSNIPENCQWATFLRSHDEINLGTLSPSVRQHALSFLDPKHEYPFNKGEATSMRIASVFKQNPARILEALRMLYRIPGAPIMYYGDEIGMQNLRIVEPRLADTRQYVRGTFDWTAAALQQEDPESLLNRISQIIKQPLEMSTLSPIEVDATMTQNSNRNLEEQNL